MLNSIRVLAAFVACACLTIGCASIVGSRAWFEQNQRPDLAPTAQRDLGCDGPIDFKPVHGDDFRDVQASGCSKNARYQLVSVGPIQKWSKASN